MQTRKMTQLVVLLSDMTLLSSVQPRAHTLKTLGRPKVQFRFVVKRNTLISALSSLSLLLIVHSAHAQPRRLLHATHLASLLDVKP